MPSNEFEYGGYRVVSNQVPEAQFDHGLGFGWGFQLFISDDKKPRYAVVIKPLFGERTEENIRKAFEIGIQKARELIDKSGFDHSYTCFRWEPDPPNFMGLTRVDCEEITPRDFRSPYPMPD